MTVNGLINTNKQFLVTVFFLRDVTKTLIETIDFDLYLKKKNYFFLNLDSYYFIIITERDHLTKCLIKI